MEAVVSELLGRDVVTDIARPDAFAHLLTEARRLHEAGGHALAVVRAQSSLEVYARAALEQLSRDRFGDAGPRVFRHMKPALNDRRSWDLLEAMVDERITAQPWWDDYRAHVERRNAIVHEGVDVTSDLAAESLEAVDACRVWLLGHWSII